MKIAIIGTRGIPNYYGGFEQFAEYLSKYLVLKGHEVAVYNSHYHPFKKSEWNGVRIFHKFDPKKMLGTVGQFIYDLNCILDLRGKNFDIILQLGYTSSSIWGWLLPSSSKIITNMDGLEWKRSKYSFAVQRFLLFAERLGIKYSDHLISDSVGIQKYLKIKYGVESFYIPYGAEVVRSFSRNVISQYDVVPYKYSMLIARLEPENSIEIILDGVTQLRERQIFLVIGNCETRYGRFLREKYKDYSNIRFLGGIYNISLLNNLRHFAKIYFHGHTVGGTNPSLLESMGAGAFICAHENIFNRSILGKNALYFESAEDVGSFLEHDTFHGRDDFINKNWCKLQNYFSWNSIVSQYEKVFIEALGEREN
jgi:hypothetical protein